MTDPDQLGTPSPLPRLRPDLRISAFEDNSQEKRFLVEAGQTCFAVSTEVKALLQSLQQDPADLAELAAILARDHQMAVAPETLQGLVGQGLPRAFFERAAEPRRATPFVFSFQILP